MAKEYKLKENKLNESESIIREENFSFEQITEALQNIQSQREMFIEQSKELDKQESIWNNRKIEAEKLGIKTQRQIEIEVEQIRLEVEQIRLEEEKKKGKK